MIETRDAGVKRRIVHSAIAMKRILLAVRAYNPQAAAELDTTFEALRDVARALQGVKELLEPDSGFHVAPDDAPGNLPELMYVGSVFERADNSLAALAPWLLEEE